MTAESFAPKSDFLRILTERGYIHQTSDLAGIDAAAGLPGAASPAELQRLAAACFDSDDYREGRTAFLAKRDPSFRGT